MKDYQRRVICAGILSLLILILVIIPASAVPVGDVRDGEISLDHARDLAQSALLESILSGHTAPGPHLWEGASLSPDPLTIYDMNGEPLFYQFDVVCGDDDLGTVRIGASRVLPSPVMAVVLTPGYWDREKLNRDAGEFLTAECPDCTIISAQPVCYRYPKIGQRVIYQEPGSPSPTEVILDAATAEPVEYAFALSYYDMVSARDLVKNREQWIREEQIHAQVLARVQTPGPGAALSERKAALLALGRSLAEIPRFSDWIDSRYTSSLAGSGTAKGGEHYLSLNLHPQETSYYCTVATIQMISEYYGQIYDQQTIARLTGTYNAGTTTQQEINFFRNVLDMEDTFSDTTPSVAEEKTELDAGRPYDSSVSYPDGLIHARACAGYRDDFGSVKFRIYDPWPPNIGEIYDEAFTDIHHYEDVFVRGSYQPDPTIAPTIPTPTPTVTVTDITSRIVQGRFTASGQQALYSFDIPAGAGTCTVTLTGLGAGADFDLYIQRGSPPSTTSCEHASTGTGAMETLTIPYPEAGKYYALVCSYSGTGIYTIRETHTSASHVTSSPTVTPTATPSPSLTTPPPAAATDITSRIVQGRFTASGQQALYYCDIPDDSGACTITLTCLGGRDYNLYVKRDTYPTLSSYDYEGAGQASTETVVIQNPLPGRYYIMVHAAAGQGAYIVRESHASSHQVTVTPTGTATPIPTPAENEQEITSRSVQGRFTASGQEALYYCDIPAGARRCMVSLSGIASRNFDLYVKRGENPTRSSYDYANTGRTFSKTVTIQSPEAGRYYVMVRATDGSGSYALRETHI